MKNYADALTFRSDNNCSVSPKVLVLNQSALEHLLFKTPGEKKKQKSVNATYPADRSCIHENTRRQTKNGTEDIKVSKRRYTCQE